MKTKGFTLIETVMIIVMLCMVAAALIPRLVDMNTQRDIQYPRTATNQYGSATIK